MIQLWLRLRRLKFLTKVLERYSGSSGSLISFLLLTFISLGSQIEINVDVLKEASDVDKSAWFL